MSERDAAQSKLSDARRELIHHKTQCERAREAADKAQRSVCFTVKCAVVCVNCKC